MDSLTRYRPTRTLRSLQDEVNRVFDTLFPAMSGGDEDMPTAMWTPRMDLRETDNAFHLSVDLPGLAKNDVHVRMEDNRLVVSGERHEEKTAKDANRVHTERTFGSFYRSIRLPKSIAEDKIGATFKNGVLTVTLPKSEKSKPKQIAIT